MVFIQKLRVDRFGAVADLDIDGLTDGVTVVHGAAETGKSNVVDFVRTIFYGFDDDIRQRHAASLGSGFGGSLSVTEGHDSCHLHRSDDGSFDGRLSLESLDASVSIGRDVQHHLAGVSAGFFDCVYALDFARRPQISTLLQEATQSGFQLVETNTSAQRKSQLRQMLDARRAELAGLPYSKETFESLRARRGSLLAEIGDLEARLTRLLDEARLRTERVPELEKQLRVSRGELRTIERRHREVKEERAEVIEKIDAIEQARSTWQRLSDELREVEERTERWNVVINDLTERRERLQKQHAALVSMSDGDPRHELKQLEQQLREFQDSVLRRGIDDHRWQAPVVAKSVEEMQSRVLELRRDLGWNETGAHVDCACEIHQLDRCESELKHSVGYLEAQHEELSAQLKGKQQREEELARLEDQLDSLDTEIARIERRRKAIEAAIDSAENELERARLNDSAEQHEISDRISRRRVELDQLEQQYHLAERHHALTSEIDRLQRDLNLLEQHQGDSAIAEAASHYLRRLSAGDYCGVNVTSDRQLFVEDPAGLRRSWHELDAGARDQVYLAFCLALVDAVHDRGINLPIVMHGAFTHYESRDVPEAAETLRDFAARGRQILLLTRHEHVVSVFRLLNAALHRIRIRGRDENVGTSDWSADGKHHHVTLVHRHHERDLEAAETHDGAGNWSGQFGAAGRVAMRSSVYALEEGDAIEAAPSLDAEVAARLRSQGVTTVGSLLELNPLEAAAALQYGVTADRIETWQAQARMMCRVPRLRPYDARILVACGIRHPSQLERLGTAEVRAMIDDFAGTSDGRAMLLSGTEYELSRITDWSRVDEADVAHDATWKRQESQPQFGGGSVPVKTSASHHTGSRSHGGSTHQADVIKLRESDDLRFYLGLEDPIVEAPSIGPRSAEQFESIGIVTVGDFLAADPDDLADQLDNRRFNADTIEQWQLQTELVCRVPHLRGHDAQILVAVDITEPEQLAQADPRHLWARVEPFVDSSAGKRIIRNGKSPDLEEIFSWVQWAGSARSLEEAA